ncbi:hypothetical protein ABZ876_37010 [Streptomyces sp. NPDC046931]|uniref:hypothetical protein n=1 Tax=Streptomyces sp. NPDC046931 TaxID=3154806 RepID=UPI003407E8FF
MIADAARLLQNVPCGRAFAGYLVDAGCDPVLAAPLEARVLAPQLMKAERPADLSALCDALLYDKLYVLRCGTPPDAEGLELRVAFRKLQWDSAVARTLGDLHRNRKRFSAALNELRTPDGAALAVLGTSIDLLPDVVKAAANPLDLAGRLARDHAREEPPRPRADARSGVPPGAAAWVPVWCRLHCCDTLGGEPAWSGEGPRATVRSPTRVAGGRCGWSRSAVSGTHVARLTTFSP